MSTALRLKPLQKRKPVQKQKPLVNARILLLAAILLTVGGGLGWFLLRGSDLVKDSTATETAVSSTIPFKPNAQPDFEATVVNTDSAPGSMPEGMVYIPGGEFSMGSLDPTERLSLRDCCGKQ